MTIPPYDPQPLRENEGKSSVGVILGNSSFILTPGERDSFVAKDPRNAERIFPYIGGEEVNTSPTQDFDRYVVNFERLSLEEATAGWPDLVQFVRERSTPRAAKAPWWQYHCDRAELYAKLRQRAWCFVAPRITTHLGFMIQPTSRVFNDGLCVFLWNDAAQFAVLQSRIHEVWARLLSSTIGEALRYSISDAFATFPFPTLTPALEPVGAALYEARAAYMVRTNQGLTKTYNALKDPTRTDPELVSLRRLHEELDRAVLDAYGWTDIPVPPFELPMPAPIHDEIITRLFALNQTRVSQQKTV